jgi:phage shock protein PspC (stress-responsive transcriptional regulator)
MERKLKRGKNRILGGVCDGLGNYFEVEPLLWRLVFLTMFCIPTIPSFLLYLIFWIAIPKEK